jgi:Photosynthesis system II assembly factor YCF48/Putative zinc-finger
MHDVPQFVLKRLQEKQPAADSHPDADLLTAFAEQSLAGDERARVMEHLTRCGDCRDVVAIALPATEIETERAGKVVALPISARPAGIGWLRWPALRWGALAAGILMVAWLGVLEYAHRSGNSVASNRPQDAVVASSVSRQAPAPQATVQQTEMQKALSATGSQTLTAHEAVVGSGRADQPPSPARLPPPISRSTLTRSGGVVRGGVAGARSGSAGGIGAGSGSGVPPASSFASPRERSMVTRAQQNPTAAAGQQVKIGAASEMVEVQADGASTTESVRTSQNQLAQNKASLPLNGRAFTNLDVVKAKDPVPGQTASSAATPRWTVGSSGVLQRSFDGGETWEDVNPALTVASSGARLAKENTARADVGSFSEAKKNQKAEAAAYPGPIFRAVAAAGLEVWAGGSGGALYHTSDGGDRWSRVTPSALGVALTGDIIAIQISDPQHGEVSTSTGELWATSDNGQTWQKRQ